MELLRKIYNYTSSKVFRLRGMKPWSWGYNAYKIKSIVKTLEEGDFDVRELKKEYGLRLDERVVEYPWFFSRLPLTAGRLLDAGSILNYDFLLSHRAITSKALFISTLAPEPSCFWNREVSYIYEDLRDTCYKDAYFDWIVSISTIEHVGFDNTFLYTDDASKKEKDLQAYLDAIKEFRRILKPDGTLYLSVPFGKQKDHGWFQVFDAKMIDQIIAVFSPSAFVEYHYRYEPDGWHVSTREASKDATCFDIHKQKTYDEDYAAFSRAVVCLEMVK